MGFLSRLRWLLFGTGRTAFVRMSCPDTGRTIATEDTIPARWREDDERIAVYRCPDCDEGHAFLWGPPAPIPVGNETIDQQDDEGDR